MTIKTHLGVFAKYWEPGKVKTRLAEDTNDDFAANLYEAFVKTTLERLTGCAETQTLVITPSENLGDFALILPPDWTLTSQVEGDLGNRMQAFFQYAIEHQSEKTILVGTDSPTLPIQIVHKAFQILEHTDCVLGPALDGGYYLVGCCDTPPPIFQNIDWSSDQILSQTCAALESAGVSYDLLPPWIDIDTIDDLNSIQDYHDESSSRLCQHIDALKTEYLG